MPAGFYYKTFMWPASAWMTYERFIRRAAGLGAAPASPTPTLRQDARALRRAGGRRRPRRPAAALAAARGRRPGDPGRRAGPPAGRRAARPAAKSSTASRPLSGSRRPRELAALPEVRILLPRTTAYGYYDHNFFGPAERVAEHLAKPRRSEPRAARCGSVRTRQVLYCHRRHRAPAGLRRQRPAGGDAGLGGPTYVRRYGVRAGPARGGLHQQRQRLRAPRSTGRGRHRGGRGGRRPPGAGRELVEPPRRRASHRRRVSHDAVPRGASPQGRAGLPSSSLGFKAATGEAGEPRLRPGLPTPAAGVPTVHLFSHRPRASCAGTTSRPGFVPGEPDAGRTALGRRRGALRARRTACRRPGGGRWRPPPTAATSGRAEAPRRRPRPRPLRWLWLVPPSSRSAARPSSSSTCRTTSPPRTSELAVREGFAPSSTSSATPRTGIGTDQGKLGNVNGMAIAADAARAADHPEVGTTTFRPPYTPVTFGALAGRDSARTCWTPCAARRCTPGTRRQRRALRGRRPVEAALVLPARGRGPARRRESRGAWRCANSVGILDASTLGKIDIQGPMRPSSSTASTPTAGRSSAVGRCRYGLMLRRTAW
jgi:sarcosine oxidase, subunit alpha